MTSEQKIVQYLNEAHALESALIQTLSAHIAITPSGEYRDLLERHLGETRDQAQNILARLSELGESRNPLELVYGIAQTAVGQLIAAGKFPIDLLRGSGGEEKLLKNAKDEAASEALEIATYDSLEAMAVASGDEETARLARDHREQEEAFLEQLREVIPQLTRDVHAAEVEGDPSFDVSSTGAADAAGLVQAAAREAASDVAERVSRRAAETMRGGSSRADDAAAAAAAAADEGSSGDASGSSSDDAGSADDGPEAPIADYDSLTVDRILPKLRLLSQTKLGQVDEYERANRNRKRILDRVAKLRASTDGQPVGTRR